MSFNKKILASAIVVGLCSTSAMAIVNISTNAGGPVKYPKELVVPNAGVVLLNAAAQLTLTSPYNYAFAAGETRYVRVECTNDVRFTTAAATDSNANSTEGAVNGVATSAVTFSVTAGAGGILASDTFTVDGTRRVTSTNNASCSYGLYDTPSQAAAGGPAGRITSATATYLDFVTSYSMTTTQGSAVANVESSPAYTNFTSIVGPSFTTTTADLGNITTALTNAAIYEADGTVLLFPEIIGVGSNHVVTGDFTASASTGATPYDAASLLRVYLDSSLTCNGYNVGADIPASALTATTATFATGQTPLTHRLCLVASGQTISEASYSVMWNVVSQNANLYTTPAIGPRTLGSITRNGTQIQAPLVQTPAGYTTRIALTNTGAQARSYVITVINEAGNTATVNAANTTGTVAANSLRVIDMSQVLTAFTGATRATVVVTLAAPNNQIQGLYQIFNPTNGAFSNHVMVRPGTN